MAFGFYSPVTVAHAQVPSTQSNFPVLVSVTDARFKTTGGGGNVQNASGFDIRPYSDTGLTTALTYELERYNSSTGEVIMWVSIASLSSSVDTPIYLAYGDATLSSDGSSASTWDSNFKAVWHLKDGTTLSGTDTTTGNNLTLNNTPTAVAGQIDGGMGLNGTNQDATPANPGDFPITTAWSVSCWVNATVLVGSDRIIVKWGQFSNNGPHIIYTSGSAQWSVRFWGGTSCNGGTPATGTWTHLYGTFDASNLRLYVGGSLAAGPTAATPASGTAAGVVGSNSLGGSFWSGSLDEIRISDVARSADWITTEFNNQSNPGSFAPLGTEVPVGGGGAVVVPRFHYADSPMGF